MMATGVFTQLMRQTLQPQGDRRSATQKFEDMTRMQWENYVNTFVPLENKLIDTAMSVTAAPNAMLEAQRDVNAAFDASQASTDRRLRGQGVVLDADQQAARARSTGVARALADVRAQSLARDLTINRQQSILGNPSPTAGAAGGGGG
jgi:hypothetical protein